MCELAHGDDRITKDDDVRAGALAFDNIDGVGIASIEMSHHRGREVSAGGRADDADVFGIDFPFTCASAHEANRARGVLKRSRVAVAIASETILEHEAGYAAAI